MGARLESSSLSSEPPCRSGFPPAGGPASRLQTEQRRGSAAGFGTVIASPGLHSKRARCSPGKPALGRDYRGPSAWAGAQKPAHPAGSRPRPRRGHVSPSGRKELVSRGEARRAGWARWRACAHSLPPPGMTRPQRQSLIAAGQGRGKPEATPLEPRANRHRYGRGEEAGSHAPRLCANRFPC